MDLNEMLNNILKDKMDSVVKWVVKEDRISISVMTRKENGKFTLEYHNAIEDVIDKSKFVYVDRVWATVGGPAWIDVKCFKNENKQEAK